jgi:hypothetical protein
VAIFTGIRKRTPKDSVSVIESNERQVDRRQRQVVEQEKKPYCRNAHDEHGALAATEVATIAREALLVSFV